MGFDFQKNSPKHKAWLTKRKQLMARVSKRTKSNRPMTVGQLGHATWRTNRGAKLALVLLVVIFLTANTFAANRFWVGGTGDWNSTDTTHWSASTGGGGGASVPVAADDVTFDGSSGGGTITLQYTPSITSLTMGAFTGTFDTNNQNMNVSGGFVTTGSGNRHLTLGSSIINCGSWSATSATNFIFDSNTSLINVITVSNFFVVSFI